MKKASTLYLSRYPRKPNTFRMNILGLARRYSVRRLVILVILLSISLVIYLQLSLDIFDGFTTTTLGRFIGQSKEGENEDNSDQVNDHAGENVVSIMSSRASAIPPIAAPTSSTMNFSVASGTTENQESNDIYNDGRGNDIILSLVRNSELSGMLQSIEEFEARFNNLFHYDWYFINDEDFNEEFKEEVSKKVSGGAKFVKIPLEFWSYPENIDKKKAAQARKKYEEAEIKYGGSESYRFMCRFNSGFFYKLPELQNIEYYWRVEPGVHFKCDITYDVFQYMRQNNKMYAFNMALGEDIKTIPTLWDTTKDFFKKNPQYVSKDNNFDFISDDGGENYNLCHFWTNFEIGNMDFYRSEMYEEYFQYLEEKGGFFYERWGDAPVHTLAVSIMMPVDQIHFVANTGYYHVPNQDCPRDKELRETLHCKCSPDKDFTWHKWSCISKFFDVNGYVRPVTVKGLKKGYPSIYESLILKSRNTI